MRKKTALRWIAVLLVAASASCAGGRRAGVVFHDPNMDFSLVQSAAVLPFVNLTSMQTAADRVRDVFMTMLQATGGTYVLPPGEVARGLARASVANSSAPSPDEVVAFAKLVKADVVVSGTLREYGEVRSGNSSANVISLSLQMMEAQTGKVVWSASSTRGGVTAADRLLGGGGEPMDIVTERAVENLLSQLFGK
jgi:hypothetical protein